MIGAEITDLFERLEQQRAERGPSLCEVGGSSSGTGPCRAAD
jgi:hypothetical protein